MHASAVLTGGGLLVLVYWEAFETIVFPRRVSRRFRLTRLFYRVTWIPWRALASRVRPGRPRDDFLSVYGPVSVLLLLATWIALLVLAFALMHWGLGSRLRTPEGWLWFEADLLLSSATLFTLGLADIAPLSGIERALTVLEGGTGLAFLAMVISYLPVLSQAFSRREVNVALLDARAGSPPSASELLIRNMGKEGETGLDHLLEEWDRWSADLLETHISFPVLAYYRSQHDNQSWVAALTTILDVTALIIAGLEGAPVQSARLTFAMARHASVDLSRVFRLQPRPTEPDRLSADHLNDLRRTLSTAGLALRSGAEVDARLTRLRRLYEPYMNALGEFLLMRLPGWVRSDHARDNWESMA